MALDLQIATTLKEHFAKIERPVRLRLSQSSHPKFSELKALLAEVASLSDSLSFEETGVVSSSLHFEIWVGDENTGIVFKAIPGGHEFSTFILAILNSVGLGKMPDASMAARVKRLKGPIHLRTFMSLSCEVCPDVIQMLNQMALLHPQFTHEIVDGDLAVDEVTRLNLQGTPAIFSGDTLLHSGRIIWLDLLEKLEAFLGREESNHETETVVCDVAIVGGGPAGVAAAIYSARKGLKVAVIAENIGGQVKETRSIENAVSIDFIEGTELVADFERRLLNHGVKLLENRRVSTIVNGEHERHLTLSDKSQVTAQSVIIATGARWRELGIAGEKEYLGRGVAFCPHCDGPYFKGRRVAVVGGGNSGIEAAIDLAGITAHVTVIEFLNQLKADQVLIDKLQSLSNVEVLTYTRPAEVLGDGTKVTGLSVEDRETKVTRQISLDGVFVQIGLLPNSGFLKDFVAMSPMGEIIIDTHNRTSQKGVYAAGDVTNIPYKQVVISIGEGAKASLSAFEDRMRGNL